MQSSKKKELSLAVLVAALVAAGGLLPLAYHYGQTHRPAATHDRTVAAVPAPAPGTGADTSVAAPPPPGTEEVPAEEAETDRGPSAASPAGPTLSFARAAGLHLTPDPMHLHSSVAYVVDQDSGQVLARKNEQAVLPIASLTKLMTTLLVLEAKQPMSEVLTITEDDVDNERHSRSRLRVGTTLTREEALHLALMSSENRAAHALGRAYPGGLPKLVEAMNAKARELGMKNTTYVDPTGLSNRNQSTAQDLAVLVGVAAKNPLLRDFSTTPAHLATLGGRTLQYRNSNRLVRNDNGGWDIALQKTGYIVEAGRCLTMLTRVAGHNLIMVLLDSDTNGARVADAERLRHWVVAQNGWQDNVAVAKAESEPAAPRKVAEVRPKARPAKHKLVAAKKDRDLKLASAKKDDKPGAAKKADKLASAKKRDQVASSKQDVKSASARKKSAAREAAVAKKDEPKKNEGRVKQTFVAGKDGAKT